jgi:hypothetical protein
VLSHAHSPARPAPIPPAGLLFEIADHPKAAIVAFVVVMNNRVLA